MVSKGMAEKVFSYLLIGIGSLQLLGLVIGNDTIRGLGFATGASPLPLVFSKFRGVENFAADFFIDVEFDNGDRLETRLTSEMYSNLKGPYNRRNPYGAVLAYGPMLTEKHEVQLRDQILRYGICSNGPLARELGYEQIIRSATISFRSKTKGKEKTWDFHVECEG